MWKIQHGKRSASFAFTHTVFPHFGYSGLYKGLPYPAYMAYRCALRLPGCCTEGRGPQVPSPAASGAWHSQVLIPFGRLAFRLQTPLSFRRLGDGGTTGYIMASDMKKATVSVAKELCNSPEFQMFFLAYMV